MPLLFDFRPILPALMLAALCGASLAQAKTRIEKAADLPRFTYTIDGKVEDLVRSPAKFAPFAAAVRRDAESVLNDYEIDDRATRTGLLGLLATLDYLDGRYDAVLQRVVEIRSLQDKPADKLVSAMRLKAMAEAAKVDGPSGEAFRRDVAAVMRRELDPLPYAVVGNNVKEAKEGAELMGEALVIGNIREAIQPVVDQNGALSSDLAPGVVLARLVLVDVLPLKKVLTETYAAYLGAHRVAKADIWAARDVALTAAQVRAPVVIGVWDSGVDTALYPQALGQAGQPAVIAFDRYSRPATGQLAPLPADVRQRLPQLIAREKGFSDLQSDVDSPEAAEIKTYLSNLQPDQFKGAMEDLSRVGSYVHGTHVAGIAVDGNPGARLVVGRIEFGWTLKPEPCPSDEQSVRDAAASQAYVDFFKAQRVRVVNMSWGGDVAAFESDLEKCGIGKSAAERKALARKYFDIEKTSLTHAFASAPEILFVTAAGNSNNDASFIESVPSGIVLPNLLTVGAVDSAGEEASFTSYGPTVKVHANGYQVESYLPGGLRVALSGTSMASPEVTNLAGKLLAVNPKLTPVELIRIITDTADRTADGRRNLVNPKKALAAAQAG